MVLPPIADWRLLALRGIAALGFGVLTLVWPGLTVWVLVVLFGFYVLVDGVFALADVVRDVPGAREHRAWLIFEAISGIAAGIITLVWPGVTALVLLFFIAGWAFAVGVWRLVAAVRYRRIVDHAWLLGLVGGLSMLFGVLLVITPGAGILVITWLVGWYAVVAGVLLLLLAWRVHRFVASATAERTADGVRSAAA